MEQKDVIIYYTIGTDLIKCKMYAEAIACFDKAIEMEPDNAYAYSSKGDALHLLGRYSEAIACFDKAIEMEPDNAYTHKLKEIVFKSNTAVKKQEAGRVGSKVDSAPLIPASGWKEDYLVKKSENISWYNLKTLQE